MNIRNISLAAIAGIFILSISSCLKDDSAAQKADEKRILEDYIASNNITEMPSESGLYYIETLAGTGDSAKEDYWMEIKFNGRLVSNNDIVMTSDLQIAKDNGIDIPGIYYGPSRLILGQISYRGLNEGIAKMKEGGKARLIFSSDLGLGGQSSAKIPPYSSLIFDIELLKVIPDIRTYENELMMQYLQASGISTDSTGYGIYYKETTAGTGELPATGQMVTVTYTGKFMNGGVFDSSGIGFNLNIGYGNVIPGFEEGVKMIKKGGSGIVVIPYYYAYGEYGRYDNYGRTVIPPFTTLVFDISVTNIAK